MTLQAVITADIVNSTKLKAEEEKKLITSIKKLLEPLKYEFYRGDSFQVYVKQAQEVLKTILLCRAVAISISEVTECDIRASIGVGSVAVPVRSLATAKGEAFILSGRAFDSFIKNDRRLIISIPTKGKEIYDIALDLISEYIDDIFGRMTAKQAEVILELLKGKTQQEIADKFKKSKSTISQLVSSAGWSIIEDLNIKFENIIKLLQ
jgi:DNA-binding MarR family transcriptional regulator